MKVLVSEKLSEHRFKDNSGYLICMDCICSRTGKQTYTRDECFGDGDQTEIEVDRTEDEVFDPKALASFENKPLTIQHPDVDVNPSNYKELSVGYLRDVHKGEYEGKPVMMGCLVVTDPEAIELVESGKLTNLSCGYDCDVEDSDHPCQRNIRGNHIALCDIPRAGNTHIQDSDKLKKDTPLANKREEMEKLGKLYDKEHDRTLEEQVDHMKKVRYGYDNASMLGDYLAERILCKRYNLTLPQVREYLTYVDKGRFYSDQKDKKYRGKDMDKKLKKDKQYTQEELDLFEESKEYFVKNDKDEKVWNSLSNDEKNLLASSLDMGDWFDEIVNDDKLYEQYCNLVRRFSNGNKMIAKIKNKNDSKVTLGKKVRNNSEILKGIDNWIIEEVKDHVFRLEEKGENLDSRELLSFIKSLSYDLTQSDIYAIYGYIKNKYESGTLFDSKRKLNKDYRPRNYTKFYLSKKKNDYGEYVVRCYVNGKYDELGTIYIDENDGWEEAVACITNLAKQYNMDLTNTGSSYTATKKATSDSEDPLHIRSLRKQVSKNVDYQEMADYISKDKDLNEAYFYAFKDAYEKKGYHPTRYDIESELQDKWYQESEWFQDGQGYSDREMDKYGYDEFSERFDTYDHFVEKGLEAFDKFRNKTRDSKKETKDIGRSWSGLAYYEYPKGSKCHVRETHENYIAFNEHGLNIGESKTRIGVETIIEEYLENKGLKKDDVDVNELAKKYEDEFFEIMARQKEVIVKPFRELGYTTVNNGFHDYHHIVAWLIEKPEFKNIKPSSERKKIALEVAKKLSRDFDEKYYSPMKKDSVSEVIFDLNVRTETQKEKKEVVKFLEDNNIAFETNDLYITIYFDTQEKREKFFKLLMNTKGE